VLAPPRIAAQGGGEAVSRVRGGLRFGAEAELQPERAQQPGELGDCNRLLARLPSRHLRLLRPDTLCEFRLRDALALSCLPQEVAGE
jgi:hypothetical protein